MRRTYRASSRRRCSMTRELSFAERSAEPPASPPRHVLKDAISLLHYSAYLNVHVYRTRPAAETLHRHDLECSRAALKNTFAMPSPSPVGGKVRCSACFPIHAVHGTCNFLS